MHKQSNGLAKLLYKGFGGAGWLLIILAVCVHLAEAEVIGIKEVIRALAALLIAGGYWLIWARPKLQAGQGWAASIPLLIVIVVSVGAEAAGVVASSSLAWLAGSIAVGLGGPIASFLLSARAHTEKAGRSG
jgi:hypothetical protein